jgi:hypothetical protein
MQQRMFDDASGLSLQAQDSPLPFFTTAPVIAPSKGGRDRGTGNQSGSSQQLIYISNCDETGLFRL